MYVCPPYWFILYIHPLKEFPFLNVDSYRTTCTLQAYAAAGTVKQNYANILLMLLRLRQACDHPLLVKGYNTDSVGKDSIEMASKLPKDMLMNLIKCLEASLAICRVCEVSFALRIDI